jgi:hypothetical protein
VSGDDAAFVADARARWAKLLEKTDSMPASSQALAVALWATLNVDRLLDIAELKGAA